MKQYRYDSYTIKILPPEEEVILPEQTDFQPLAEKQKALELPGQRSRLIDKQELVLAKSVVEKKPEEESKKKSIDWITQYPSIDSCIEIDDIPITLEFPPHNDPEHRFSINTRNGMMRKTFGCQRFSSATESDKKLSPKNLQHLQIPDLECNHGSQPLDPCLVLAPGLCQLWGSAYQGGQAGETLQVYLQPVGLAGENLRCSHLRFYLRVSLIKNILPLPAQFASDGEIMAKIEFKESESGFYSARFMCSIAGEYQLKAFCCSSNQVKNLTEGINKDFTEVLLGKTNSQLIRIIPSCAFGPTSKIEGISGDGSSVQIIIDSSGCILIELDSGVLLSMMIQAYDRHGNKCVLGNDEIRVESIGGAKIQDPIDWHNGKYEIRFLVPTHFSHCVSGLDVYLNESLLYGSPIRFRIRQLPAPIPLCPSQHFKASSLPIPPTYPPFPDASINQLNLPNHFTPLTMLATHHQLEQYATDLCSAQKQLTSTWNSIRENPDRLSKFVLSAAMEKTHDLESAKTEHSELKNEANRMRDAFYRCYSCLQYKTIDTLPVEFELADQGVIKQEHDEERRKLKEIHDRLKTRLANIKEREDSILAKREELLNQISKTIKTRNQSAVNQTNYLGCLQNQIQRKTVKTIRRQLRREDLDASSFDAVATLGAVRKRTDLVRGLSSSNIRLSKRPPEMPSGRSIPKANVFQQANVFVPDNPTTPAFWVAEGRYRRHVFTGREAEAEKSLFKGKTVVPQKKKPNNWHLSKAYWVDVGGVSASVKEKRQTQVRSKPDTPETTAEAAEKHDEEKTASGMNEKLDAIEQYDKHVQPPGMAAMKNLLMLPPVPPQQARRIYRLHHLT